MFGLPEDGVWRFMDYGLEFMRIISVINEISQTGRTAYIDYRFCKLDLATNGCLTFMVRCIDYRTARVLTRMIACCGVRGAYRMHKGVLYVSCSWSGRLRHFKKKTLYLLAYLW